MMKVFIGFLLAVIILSAGAYWGYQVLSAQKQTTTTSAPSFTNPFASKPSSSFSSTSAETTNPFVEPTPENPFGATGSQTYQNPFSALR